MPNIKTIITHPLFIVLLFCAIIISGEQMGGFYLLYILLGLPHFALHAVLGALGIICLLSTYYIRKTWMFFLCVLGAIFMIISLLCFFLQPNGSYNYNTFHEVFPLSILVLFSVLIIVFIIKNISAILDNIHKKKHPVN